MSQSILITGASSGIGRALALELAGRGYRQALAARRLPLLTEIQAEIKAQYPDAIVTIHRLDVTEYETLPGVVAAAAEALGGLDIVFANAGLGRGEQIGHGRFADTRLTIETNLLGAMATVDAAVAHFRQQGHGHIVGNASLAAFRGLPGAASYCASKAGLATYMEGLRAELHGTDIAVTVLYPGYIDTPINEEMASRPFVISAAASAPIFADFIAQRVKARAVPTWPWAILRYVMPLLPTSVVARLNQGE